MPISEGFTQRLIPKLSSIAAEFGTPFHIYDEQGIKETCRRFKSISDNMPFRQFFAVKALPNPHVLRLLYEEGMGFDCASIPEIELARMTGARGEEIFFTSNNTQDSEFKAAQEVGAILNLDDDCFLNTLSPFPDLACFRIAAGSLDRECQLMGPSEASKFGVPIERVEATYRRASKRGATRFGIHAMFCSNERDAGRALDLAAIVLQRAKALSERLGIEFEFVNIGGGIGIPYAPGEAAFDFDRFAHGLTDLKTHHLPPSTALYMECGRYVTGPHGVLVTRVANVMEKFRTMVGVDASMSALMRPALYKKAYHEITLPFSNGAPVVADVVGSLCENNDKFAIQRRLPRPERGDLLMVHDTGAHGLSMGFTYNGRLRPQELLLRADGRVERIRRAETVADYFATITNPPSVGLVAE